MYQILSNNIGSFCKKNFYINIEKFAISVFSSHSIKYFITF